MDGGAKHIGLGSAVIDVGGCHLHTRAGHGSTIFPTRWANRNCRRNNWVLQFSIGYLLKTTSTFDLILRIVSSHGSASCRTHPTMLRNIRRCTTSNEHICDLVIAQDVKPNNRCLNVYPSECHDFYEISSKQFAHGVLIQKYFLIINFRKASVPNICAPCRRSRCPQIPHQWPSTANQCRLTLSAL